MKNLVLIVSDTNVINVLKKQRLLEENSISIKLIQHPLKVLTFHRPILTQMYRASSTPL